ncbi:hypothetical protein OTU49_014771 [Cherax quadricarinatus]|uniref:Major facilitator superfamily (MFS) profile domain-containing protein n=1 Tax=Cherax quadricarinatus TaxID=27406 RepID=A0AAW0YBP6_CHEQU
MYIKPNLNSFPKESGDSSQEILNIPRRDKRTTSVLQEDGESGWRMDDKVNVMFVPLLVAGGVPQHPGQDSLQHSSQDSLQHSGQDSLQHPGQDSLEHPGQDSLEHPGQGSLPLHNSSATLAEFYSKAAHGELWLKYSIPDDVSEDSVNILILLLAGSTSDNLTVLKEEWSLVVEGTVLSSVYWTGLITALIPHKLLHKIDAVVVLAASVGVAGVVGLLTHAASLGGPWLLLASRLVLGVGQGVMYPTVARVLEELPRKTRPWAALVVFTGPYLGTALGGGLGSLPQWYICSYLVGSLALPLALLCLTLPRLHHRAPRESVCWGQVLRSQALWSLAGVHLAYTWMLHTLLVGVPFCLTYIIGSPTQRGLWMLVAPVMAVMLSIVLCRGFHLLLGEGRTSALNRRRFPVVTGFVIVLVCVVVLATVGLDTTLALVCSATSAGLGLGTTRVGYTLNMDDVAPGDASNINQVFDVVGIATAAVSPLVLTALAQSGARGWVGVWLVPLVALVPAAVLYLFLLTTNPLPWHKPVCVVDGTNGAAVVDGVYPSQHHLRQSVRSKQSFKSALSTHTFKTARSRARTVSCQTINDDLEADMHSVEGSNVECHSVEEADPQCYSVASSSTFKSDEDMQSAIDGVASVTEQQGQQFGYMLSNGVTTDKTAAWLSSHHDLATMSDSQRIQPPATKKEIHANNSVYGLFW